MTADHRIIYGADAASFLKDLAILLQTNAQSLTL
jgi:pyruvate dehydrogenase E2 component (dihydrolipoamide acetyltransferase)